MTELADRIFSYMRSHRLVCVLSILAITALMAIQAMRLNYKEDITDFLPLDDDYQNAIRVYEEISGGGKIVAIFELVDSTEGDADCITLAIDDFADIVSEKDSSKLLKDILYQVDADKISEVADFVYSNIPYFLTQSDYARIDSLTSDSTFAIKALKSAKEQLMLPTGDMAAIAIRHDPAGLFAPVMKRLQQEESGLSYEIYDGHVFSPDMSRGIAIATSSAGATESDKNGLLATLMQECADSVMEQNPAVAVHLTGGPIIAAGNSAQIKSDCTLSVAISSALILALLILVFGNVRDMILIGLPVAWGWLFALSGMSAIRSEMSMIVLGISSVIIGIAVNYPLHYLSHLRHTPDKRMALREIATPLIIGNITTVGAFLALVPLNSAALRDLGLFASLMLIGTIIFVIIYLPHAAAIRPTSRHNIIVRLCEKTPANRPALLWVIAGLTIVFGIYSLNTSFDTDMGNINYMTEQQEADIEYFESQLSKTGPERKIYAIVSDSTPDLALAKNEGLRSALSKIADIGKAGRISYCGEFLHPEEVQTDKLKKWADFKNRKWDEIQGKIAEAAELEGFTENAFEPFYEMGRKEFQTQGIEHFAPLCESVFSSNISIQAGGRCSVVSIMDVDEKNYSAVKAELSAAGAYAFDVKGMNGKVAESLSDDFNYIGWACGLIVFLFLWFSFGSLELAVISFLPMAASWVWILGIMAIIGIKFNIVNVILATFIFGQGDDYTIFMTEGASYEYTYRKKMLASYKSSILLSALIMFIGIGTLIVAKHPALRSLAEVTIAGMTSVVLMAYILPPLLFGLLVGNKNGYWRRPIYIGPLVKGLVYHLTGKALGVKAEVAPDSLCNGRHGQCIFACSADTDIVRKILHGWDQSISSKTDYDVRLSKGDSVVMSTDKAIEMSEAYNLPIRPISVFGINEIIEAGSPCLYSGIVTIKIADEISHVDISREQLYQVCKENDTANALQSTSLQHFTGLVKDRFRFKEGNIFRTVCSHIKSGKAVEEASKCLNDNGLIDITEENYGSSALLAALTHPEMKIVARTNSSELASVLRFCADGVASNLEIVVYEK